ncbi:ASCH domain-containing protein [Nocardioides ultimimeridianus]
MTSGRKRPWATKVATRPSRALLISIQPRYAEAILTGTKTIELRRTMPTLEPGALALIYSSTPTKALVGWATVEHIVQATPTALWNEHKDAAGITASEFSDYFGGRLNAYGLRLGDVTAAECPVPLAELRKHALQPPQSWRYISDERASMLIEQMSGRPSKEGGTQRAAAAIA